MRGYSNKVVALTALLCGCAAQSYSLLNDQYLEESMRKVMLGHADCPAPVSLVVEDGDTEAGVTLYSQCSSTEVTIVALSPFGFSRGKVYVRHDGQVKFHLHSSLATLSVNEIIMATLIKTD
jgi:hypothetical protein